MIIIITNHNHPFDAHCCLFGEARKFPRDPDMSGEEYQCDDKEGFKEFNTKYSIYVINFQYFKRKMQIKKKTIYCKGGFEDEKREI